MKICNAFHGRIVYEDMFCPLCALIKHNNKVHDFIESKGPELVQELVKYQQESKDANTD